MVLTRETDLYRRDARSGGVILTAQDRENLIKPYLPFPPKPPSTSFQRRIRPIRVFLKTQLHILTFAFIHACFSLYMGLRRTFHAVLSRVLAIIYYHHRTPELIRKDMRCLSRLPEHLSVMLELQSMENGSIEVLLEEMAEIAAWCACAGIPMLSVYEKTGVLKNLVPRVHRTVAGKIHSYFGRRRPSLQIRAPHMPTFLNGDTSERNSSRSDDAGYLSILLLSAEDGRSTLVDLTKTLVEMSQHQKLSPGDISVDLIDAEISESIMGEPDLLLLFGPNVKLQGYPPWQLRLTEIFHLQDNEGVEYQVFLRALHRYAKVQMRFGR